MITRRKFLAIVLLAVTILSIAGCGSKNTDELTGKWAYIHATDEPALIIKSNGTAKYKGNSYSYSRDDSYIYLSSKNENLSLRFEKEGDKILLYVPTTYDFSDGQGEPQGIVGYWEDKANNWSYQFTDDYQFVEDGYFVGTYDVNPEGSITLTYNDDFTKTTIYYRQEGTKLMIEYPWPMVKMK